MLRKISLAVLSLLLSFAVAKSQTAESKVYNLQEVLRITLKNNYDLRLNNANIEYSESELKSAFGKYLPGFAFSSSYQRRLNPREELGALNYPDYYNMRLGADFTLFDGFSREANYSRAQSNLKSSKLSLEQSIQSVYLDAYEEYINIVRSKQVVRIRRENLEVGKAELERIRARHEAGVLPITAVYSQEADLGNREMELYAAENELDNYKARLMTIMGMDPDITVDFSITSIPSEIRSEDVENFKSGLGSMPSAIEKALNNRLDYQAAKLRFESAEFSKKIAESAYYPKLGATADWSWNNTEFGAFDKGNYYFGLNLQVPIFSNFAVDAQVQSMKLSLEQKNIELLRLEQNIRSSVQIAYINLSSAEKQLAVSEKTVFSAEQNYESTKERVQVGAATVNDLIQANTQLITSQINRITAVYNYIKSQNDIKFAIGDLGVR